MAYDALKKEKTQPTGPNPYAGIAGGVRAQAEMNPDAVSSSPDGTGMAGAGGPTATGHVNFDQLYNANADVAKREAGSRQDATDKQVENAYAGLTGAQGKFSSGLTGAASTGPNASQQAWGANSTATQLHGKRVADAYFYAPGGSAGSGPGGYSGKAVPDEHRTSEVTTADAGSDDAERRAVARGEADNSGKKWDSLADYDAAHASSSGGGTAPNPNQSYITEEQEGLGSPVLPPKMDESGNPIPGTGYPPYDPSSPGAQQAAADAASNVFTLGDPSKMRTRKAEATGLESSIRAGASDEYAGPGALSAMDEYGKLATDFAAAQDRALNPLTGMNETDAALLGAAGRPRFEGQKRQYGGLKKSLEDANTASIGEAAAAKKRREENAKAYQALIDQQAGDSAAFDAEEKKRQEGGDKIIADAKKKQTDQLAYNEAMGQANEGLNAFRNTMHGAANALNPADWVARGTGNKTLTELGTDYYGKIGGDRDDKFNAGNASAAWGADDSDVFGSMTPEDWAEFNSLGLDGQRGWIAKRKKKLRGGE